MLPGVGDVFKALSDPTRRAILDELRDRDGQTLFELCVRLITNHGSSSTRQAISQHLGVLEDAGLVITEKVGRVRTCRIGARRLEEVTAWIERYRQLWDARFCELDKVVEELKRKEKLDGRKKAK